MELRTGERSETAFRKIRRQGFELAPEPDSDPPRMPSDITSISGEELSQLSAKFLSWTDYVEVQVAAALLDAKAADSSYDEQLMKAMRAHPQKNAILTRAAANEEPMVQSARESADNADAYAKIMQTVYNRYERARALLSRELTRRTTTTAH